MTTNLSRYFEPQTAYYYGYPAGEDSQFYNSVPPEIEELVAARALTCAGDAMRIVTFRAAVTDRIKDLLVRIGTETADDEQIISFPDSISADVRGTKRNTLIRQFLSANFRSRDLIMAQPYSEEGTENAYAIPFATSATLNDKSQLASIVPQRYLPSVLGSFADGFDFTQSTFDSIPCVVKISSSSSGDGVRICKTIEELRTAQTEFASVAEPIFIEQFIDSQESIGVQFAIPRDTEAQPEVSGFSKQIVNESGECLGGIVASDTPVPENIERVLLEQILPRARKTGWFGVGGFDVLCVSDDEFYFIDPNFRMTAVTPFVWQSANKAVSQNQATFNSAVFQGSADELVRLATRNDANQKLNIIAATQTDGGFRLCGSMLFDQEETMIENAIELSQKGLRAKSLQFLTRSDR